MGQALGNLRRMPISFCLRIFRADCYFRRGVFCAHGWKSVAIILLGSYSHRQNLAGCIVLSFTAFVPILRNGLALRRTRGISIASSICSAFPHCSDGRDRWQGDLTRGFGRSLFDNLVLSVRYESPLYQSPIGRLPRGREHPVGRVARGQHECRNRNSQPAAEPIQQRRDIACSN